MTNLLTNEPNTKISNMQIKVNHPEPNIEFRKGTTPDLCSVEQESIMVGIGFCAQGSSDSSSSIFPFRPKT